MDNPDIEEALFTLIELSEVTLKKQQAEGLKQTEAIKATLLNEAEQYQKMVMSTTAEVKKQVSMLEVQVKSTIDDLKALKALKEGGKIQNVLYAVIGALIASMVILLFTHYVIEPTVALDAKAVADHLKEHLKNVIKK